MKNNTKKLLSVFCAACILTATTACGGNGDIVLDEIGRDVGVHTEVQMKFLTSDDYLTFDSWLAEDGSEEASRPVPVHFSWSAKPNLKGKVEKYVLEISEWKNFSDALEYETTETGFDVYNLKVGTYYHWRVTAKLSDGTKKVSQKATFQTEDATPRNLYVDGMTNVRDLGGWQTIDGDFVRQGMIYRCARLNVSQINEIEAEITEQGIRTMRDELGVRTEIDLRMDEDHVGCVHGLETSGLTYSLLGEDINYYNVPMEYIMGDNFNYLSDSRFYPSIREFFTYLSDEENYPIAYHCNIGTDRTGLFAFLINGLLGVPEEDLYRDYLFSNFGNIGVARTVKNIQSYATTIRTYEGDTFAAQIENCLLDIGVQREDIAAMKDLMIE